MARSAALELFSARKSFSLRRSAFAWGVTMTL